MRGLKLIELFKSNQVHALNSSDTAGGGGGARVKVESHRHQDKHGVKSFGLFLKQTRYGVPSTDLMEPTIDPFLKPVNLVETLADVYRRLETCCQSDKSLVCIEQYSLLVGLGDAKLLRRCLCAARENAVDVHMKVVVSAWLQYDRREDELVGVSSMDCGGHIFECPKAALVFGYDPNSSYDHCQCVHNLADVNSTQIVGGNEYLSLEEDNDVTFCIGDEEINCVRNRIAMLSDALNTMLYGSFVESKRKKIDLSLIGVSVEGMRAVNMYSRTRRFNSFCPGIVLQLLSFANRFCCEEMKSACDAHLASLVCDIEDALVLIEYGLEETASLLVASCLQVLLRELPSSLYYFKVMTNFCSLESRKRLAMVGHASFLLYYFLSQVAMEENRTSNITVMLLERLRECATEWWQKAIAMHQMGCVMLERKEYKVAQCWFEAAAEAGHIYSLAGVARTMYKQEQRCSAYKLMNSLISDSKPVGWMYQERSLYNVGKGKILDLNAASELDPSLSFPSKYRAIEKMEKHQIRAAISEIDKLIGFKLSSDSLELRAWFFILIEEYESALRDIRVLLTLEPDYMLFNGKVSGDHLVELLSHRVQQWSPADCWVQLYERWSSVDDVGSLAVIHQMLVDNPGNSILRFRQSLLLLRLNCQKVAIHCLRLARNNSGTEQERLVYEGWILYDTGYREEALSKAEKSICIQRSFEAFFLKAYILADNNADPKSLSYVIQLLEEALRCPSDGLRKGQALNNLASIYVDCGKLDMAKDCYKSALEIKHTRAHQGLARVYHLTDKRKAAYDEMTKLIEKSKNNASAYEKRSEYCDRDVAKNDLNMATKLDPLRTYPYRYRAAVLMDDQKEAEALEELTKAISFKPDLQMLHLRAAFYESIGDLPSALRDCEAAFCLDSNHTDTLDLYNRAQDRANNQHCK